jgi:uncharacterized protein DUF4234
MTEQPGPGGGQQQEQQQQPAAPPPAAQPPVAPPAPKHGVQNREPGIVWVLAIFTGGIYGAIWYYQLCKEIGETLGEDTDPVMSVLAVTLGWFILVPPFVSWSGTLGRVRQAQEKAGLEPRATFGAGFGLTLLLSYSYYWLQEQLNEIAARQPA